jgi:hypothetical protein
MESSSIETPKVMPYDARTDERWYFSEFMLAGSLVQRLETDSHYGASA